LGLNLAIEGLPKLIQQFPFDIRLPGLRGKLRQRRISVNDVSAENCMVLSLRSSPELP
jgi:hypothetical protein